MNTHTPLRRRLCTCITLFSAILVATPAIAQLFDFTNITDQPQGPGQGAFPSINDDGDVAFQQDKTIFLYDRDQGTFLNIHSLPGAPAEGRYPRGARRSRARGVRRPDRRGEQEYVSAICSYPVYPSPTIY